MGWERAAATQAGVSRTVVEGGSGREREGGELVLVSYREYKERPELLADTSTSMLENEQERAHQLWVRREKAVALLDGAEYG